MDDPLIVSRLQRLADLLECLARLGLEACDEVPVLGELGKNDLDRYLAINGRLVGTVNRAKTTGAYALKQLQTAHALAHQILHDYRAILIDKRGIIN